MGQYLVPGDNLNLSEVAMHVAKQLGGPQVGQRVHPAEGGVLFVDENRPDEEVAALFTEFTPTLTADERYEAPLPDGVRIHLQHLRDYLAKDAATITNAETVHVVKDLIRAVHHLNRRFETEG